eukprot:1744961-Prymnesium_polylepis.1
MWIEAKLQLRAWTSAGAIRLVVVLAEGIIATSARAARALMQPLKFSPRFSKYADLWLIEWLTMFPSIPSSCSTFLVSTEYLLVAFRGTRHSFDAVIRFAALAAGLTMASLQVNATSKLANFFHHLMHLIYVAETGNLPLEFQWAQDARNRDLQEATTWVLVALTAATAFFILAMAHTLHVMRRANVVGSERMGSAATELRKYVCVQVLFTIPVIVNVSLETSNARQLVDDTAVGSFAFSYVAAHTCELVVATAQILHMFSITQRLSRVGPDAPALTLRGSASPSVDEPSGLLFGMRLRSLASLGRSRGDTVGRSRRDTVASALCVGGSQRRARCDTDFKDEDNSKCDGAGKGGTIVGFMSNEL